MAKKTVNNNLSDEATTPAALNSDIGALPTELQAKLEVVDVLDSMPTFVPAKPGFEIGKTLAGYYLGTKRVISDKFTAGKVNDQGEKYRDLHMLRDAKDRPFGIWSVGQLGYIMRRVSKNQLVAITYEGRLDAPIKPGQQAPHNFTVQAQGGLLPDLGDDVNEELAEAARF